MSICNFNSIFYTTYKLNVTISHLGLVHLSDLLSININNLTIFIIQKMVNFIKTKFGQNIHKKNAPNCTFNQN